MEKTRRKTNTVLPKPLIFDSGSRRTVSNYIKVHELYTNFVCLFYSVVIHLIYSPFGAENILNFSFDQAPFSVSKNSRYFYT